MLSYRDALRLIFARSDFERGIRPPYAERVWRLDRVRELLEAIGDPHKAYRSVHVAGTKGKGSTTAMIEAVLRAAGYQTGMYTSPHLHTFRERIRIGGELIPERDVCQIMTRLKSVLDSRPLVTVFEIITALAMDAFRERKVEWAVFEVGLGGRLDATNVIAPAVSVITSISMDHVAVLGNSIAAIAGEKAGIIKPGTPVVTSPQHPEAMAVIKARAEQHKAPLTVVGRDWSGETRAWTQGGQEFAALHGSDCVYPSVRIPLLGDHQIENAVVALAAIEQLREQNVDIPRDAVTAGMASVHWPGRLQRLSNAPAVIVDGAHNPYSLQKILQSVQAHLGDGHLLVVFGASRSHDPVKLLAEVLPACMSVYLTQANHPKATPADDLLTIASKHSCRASTHADTGRALGAAVADARSIDTVLVTGSLFVVAEAMSAWARIKGLPAYPSDPPGSY